MPPKRKLPDPEDDPIDRAAGERPAERLIASTDAAQAFSAVRSVAIESLPGGGGARAVWTTDTRIASVALRPGAAAETVVLRREDGRRRSHISLGGAWLAAETLGEVAVWNLADAAPTGDPADAAPRPPIATRATLNPTVIIWVAPGLLVALASPPPGPLLRVVELHPAPPDAPPRAEVAMRLAEATSDGAGRLALVGARPDDPVRQLFCCLLDMRAQPAARRELALGGRAPALPFLTDRWLLIVRRGRLEYWDAAGSAKPAARAELLAHEARDDLSGLVMTATDGRAPLVAVGTRDSIELLHWTSRVRVISVPGLRSVCFADAWTLAAASGPALRLRLWDVEQLRDAEARAAVDLLGTLYPRTSVNALTTVARALARDPAARAVNTPPAPGDTVPRPMKLARVVG